MEHQTIQTAEKVEEYPVPKSVDAINIQDNQRFNKDHFVINETYRVI